MKLPLVLTRVGVTTRELRAGCYVCHGDKARWTSSNAQALAAQHHDRTGHPTWCDIALAVRYGRVTADDRQIDLEDAIASSSSGGEPDAAPLPDPDAPATVIADVSAPQGRPVETRASMARGARGRKPETAAS